MQTLTIEGKVRANIGKNASNASRNNHTIPCVLYGGGVNVNFETTEKAVRHLIYTPNFYKVSLNIDGATHEAFMREIQFHPVSDKVLHIDFLKLNPSKKIIIEVPVKLIGQAEGVKAGAKMVQKIRKIKVKAFPQDLVDAIELDVTPLEVGKSIRIGEINVPNVEILGTKSMPVASCLIPRVLKVEETKPEAAAAATPAAGAATPEATAEKKDDKKDKK
ncbi:MAG: 50S ribosomal protein L25/general stress protein Ctc [Fimbriimonadaceae bacterium]|nr:50S ribosomal protein L25/general stress protein Ctc [Chitinophagales bacterium]